MSRPTRTRRALLAALASLGCGAVAGCTADGPRARDTGIGGSVRAHTQFRQGLQNNGYIDVSVPERVTVAWRLPTNRGAHTASKGSPVQTPAGNLIIADDTGRVRSVTPDGTIRWARQITGAQRGSHGTPAIANETAYIGAYDGTVTALALETGTTRWQETVGDAVGASPTYYDGRLYVAVEHATPSGSVVAMDAGTGVRTWRGGQPTDHPHSTVAVDRDHGRLLVGSNDGHCYAWSFPELREQWTYDTGGAVKAPIAVADGIAVVPSWANTLTGLDVTDGTPLWTVDTDGKCMCAPAVHDGTVYAGSHDHTLYAVDLATGQLVWTRAVGGSITGSAVATRDRVLVGAYDGRLYAVDRADGTIAWTAEARGEVTGAPLVTDGAIYVTGRAAGGDPDSPGMCYKLVRA